MLPRLRLFATLFLFWLGFFLVGRAGFLVYHHRQAAELASRELAGTFLHGLRLDLSAAAYLTAVPGVLLALSALPRLLPAARWVMLGFVPLALALLSLLAVTDLEIYRHWDRRIDAAVLPYFSTPAELWASTGGSPRLLLIVLGAATLGLALLVARRVVGSPLRRLQPCHPAVALPILVLTAALAIPARGGLQEISLNQSSAYFSDRVFANLAALNPAWNFFDSLRRGLSDRGNPYAAFPPEEARRIVDTAGGPAEGGQNSVRRVLRTTRPNLLLVIWESATARAVGSLGGLPGVTPALDSLSREGLRFTRFYAAGDRTDKGLVALLSGFPTTPRVSILKVPGKTAKLPSLGADLRAAGYRTAFYYGGELEFANLGAYLHTARFERLVGKDAFPRSSWNSKWGAHDGVVARRLLADLAAEPGEPFFVAWLTLSSHEPFETPDPPRIVGDTWEPRFLNSLAYTDAVLGDFVRRAQAMPWWRNTLLVIVADHGRHLEETDRDAPYKSAEAFYRIPMLWLGGALAPRDSAVSTIGSQTDLPGTLLGQLGLPGGERYHWGHDLLTSAAVADLAYYAFDDGFGLVTRRGDLVYDNLARRVLSRHGAVGGGEVRLGRALLQLSYQAYLER